MNSRISAGLAGLAMVSLLVGSVPAPAAKKKNKPKHWVGKPVSELIAVMGAPEKERPGRNDENRILLWFRYPITTPYADSQGRVVTGSWDQDSDVDPPPIPGDPTVQQYRVIQCSVTVGPGGIISKVNLPKACHVPAAPEPGDEDHSKPELPHQTDGDDDEKPPGLL
jgi:hypothetical protein